MINKSKMRRDDLFWQDFYIYQDPQGFCFSQDALLLACYCPAAPNWQILDCAAGNGILPILLTAREPSLRITGLELNEETAALARYNMTVNNIDAKIITGDMMKASAFLAEESFNCLIANPPYYKKGTVRPGKNQAKNLAKIELAWDTTGFFRESRRLLKKNGLLVTAYPAQRWEEIKNKGEIEGLYQEQVTWIISETGSEPYLFLCRWRTEPCQGQEKSLTLKTSEGHYNPEIIEIFKERTWRY